MNAKEMTNEELAQIYYGSGQCGVAEARKIAKDQRIVAELAKADAYITDPVHNNICHLAYDALKKCRAIAEEGDAE